ncbi:hypothetical protein [Wolbachia endosymbiont of Trichogramma kaykai]|uniref:hypothetical protein n=1 Tax=Wolbachia endosymbiont of Trichogramma kaykai TaxID=444066 RepID=UPI0038914112
MHNSRDKEVTQILLDAGTNLFIKDHYGITARKHARDESKQLLKKAEDKYKHKTMKFGAIFGITAGMGVGSGLFAASAFIGTALYI